jgi:hypothetical protein
MYRLVVLVLAALLAFGCATANNSIMNEMDATIEALKKQPTLEELGIPPKYFESMMSRIIISGHLMVDPQFGEIRIHFAEAMLVDSETGKSMDYEFIIGWIPDLSWIMTTATELDTAMTVAWLDVDADGVPEIVNDNGKGNADCRDIDLQVYAKVVMTLLQKPVYYPPCDEGCDEQQETIDLF